MNRFGTELRDHAWNPVNTRHTGLLRRTPGRCGTSDGLCNVVLLDKRDRPALLGERLGHGTTLEARAASPAKAIAYGAPSTAALPPRTQYLVTPPSPSPQYGTSLLATHINVVV